MSISSEIIGSVAVGNRTSFWKVGSACVSMVCAALLRIARGRWDDGGVTVLYGVNDRELRDIGLIYTDAQAIAQGACRVRNCSP